MAPRTPIARRRFVTATAVGVLSGLAGCGGETDVGRPVSNAPEGSAVLVGADMALLEHDGTERLLEAYDGIDLHPGRGEDASRDLVSEFEARTGLDATGASRALVFAPEPGSDQGAFVLEAEWTESTVVASLESTTGHRYEPSDHAGGTVYAPVDAPADADHLGVATEGRFVLGVESAVRAAVATALGEGEGVGGAIREAYDDAVAGGPVVTQSTTDATAAPSSPFVVATTDAFRQYLPPADSESLPPGVSLDVYESVRTATVAYAAEGTRVAVDGYLVVDSEAEAGEVADFTATAVAYFRSRIGDAAVAAEFEKLDVAAEGRVVTLRYRTTVEGALVLLEWL